MYLTPNQILIFIHNYKNYEDSSDTFSKFILLSVKNDEITRRARIGHHHRSKNSELDALKFGR